MVIATFNGKSHPLLPKHVKINYFKPKGLFRKFVGGHMFYLGSDKLSARKLATVISILWCVRKAQGKAWHENDLEFIKMAKDQVYRGLGRLVYKYDDEHLVFGLEEAHVTPRKSSGAQVEGGSTGATTIGDAMEAFKSQFSGNPLVAASHRSTMIQKVDSLKAVLSPDRAVSSMGYDELTALVSKLASRPKSAATGKKIAAQTALNLIGAARQFFYWLRDSGRWQEPRGFDRIFRVNRRALLTNRERKDAAKGIETFTVEELAKLWGAANEQNRLFLALALNCGFAQMEIATLRTWEVDLESLPKRIARNRRKTKVYGSWELWDVTAGLLERRLGRTPKNAEELALLTRYDKPYVRYSNGGRSDAIALAWQKLVAKAGVTKLSFRFLRKTGADMIRKIAGLEVSEAYLAHSEKSLARVYSNRDFDKLAEALTTMRSQLSAVFDEKPTEPEAEA